MMTGKNPYERFLEGRDGAVLVREFPARLKEVVSKLGAEGWKRRLAPEKWTVSETLCHMADTEIAFSYRWRQTLAEESHQVQTFDQDLWAPRYSTIPGEQALRALLALRAWNIVFLEGLTEAAWSKQVTHPELGVLTFRTLVEIMAGHDLNHLAHLEQLASGRE